MGEDIEDGSETKIVRSASVDDMKKIMVSTMSLTGTLELEKLNPQNVDFKLLAKKLTLGKMSIKPENVQDILKNTQKNVIDNQSHYRRHRMSHRWTRHR